MVKFKKIHWETFIAIRLSSIPFTRIINVLQAITLHAKDNDYSPLPASTANDFHHLYDIKMSSNIG